MYRPENFILALMSLRPTLNPRQDIVVDRNASGPFISSWTRLDITQPTLSQIQAVDTDAIKVVPIEVTPRQARLALYGAGLLANVETMVTSIGGTTKITWDNASTILRTDPLIASMATSLGLTSSQVDQLFITAATL